MHVAGALRDQETKQTNFPFTQTVLSHVTHREGSGWARRGERQRRGREGQRQTDRDIERWSETNKARHRRIDGHAHVRSGPYSSHT